MNLWSTPPPPMPERQPLPVAESPQQQAFTKEITPYLNIGVDTEIKDHLGNVTTEVESKGFHIVNSNDRYQATALNLALAQNHFLLAFNIGSRLTSDEGADLVAPQFGYASHKDMVVGAFNTMQKTMDAADRVEREQGFQLSAAQQSDMLAIANGTILWPHPNELSRRVVQGGLEAIDQMYGYAFYRNELLKEARPKAPERMFIEQQRHVLSLLSEAEQHRNMISQIVGPTGNFMNVSSLQALTDMQRRIQAAFGVYNKLAVVMYMPRLLYPPFGRYKGLEENAPWQRSFSPNTLAAPALPQVVQPPAPKPSGRPFSPEDLRADPSADKASQPKPAKPFNPADLGGSNSKRLKPFNPDFLG